MGTINGTVINIYLDGQLQGTNTLPSTVSASGQSFWIGGQNRGSYNYRFKGYIDEAVMHDRVLSAEQIQTIYQRQYHLIDSQELKAGDSWQGAITPNDGIANGTTVFSNLLNVTGIAPVASFTSNITFGTAPLAIQFNDTSTNTPTSWNWSFRNVTGNNTAVWWSTVRNATQTFGAGNFSIAVNASNSAGYNISTQVTFINVTAANTPPVVSNVVLTSTSGFNRTSDNLTLTWDVSDPDGNPVRNITNWYRNANSITVLNMPFEGGSNATFTKDYSGYGNNGAVNGATWNAIGGYDGGGAYNFSGTGYMTVPDSQSLWVKDAITIEAWIYPTDLSGYRVIAGKWSPKSYMFECQAGGIVAVSMTSDGTTDNGLLSTHTITTNTWHHVAGTYDSATGRMVVYIDGVPDTNKTTSGSIYQGNAPVWIGENSGAAGQQFRGRIDDLRIYNRSLSADEVSAHYLNRTDLIVSQELILSLIHI